MNRREFLRRGGFAAGFAALAGCTSETLQEAEREPPLFEAVPKAEIDLPVSQRLAVAEAGIERAADAEIEAVEDLEAYLAERDVHVETLEGDEEAGEPILTLEYADDEYVERGLMHPLGIVCGGYAALADATHEGEKLVAHLLDETGRAFGEYEVRREWADAYNEGDLTARKYADEVAVTVESV